MDPGTFLLTLAALLAGSALLLALLHLWTREGAYERFLRIALTASVLLSVAAFFLMVAHFLTGNVGIAYVHSYTDVRYDWFLKLLGVWNGEAGTIFLWTVLIGVALAAKDILQSSATRGGARSDLYPVMRLFGLLFFVGFLVLLLAQDMFAPTAPETLLASPYGSGLNFLLRTPFMAVHPPLEFAGYAASILPASAALAFLVTGDREWTVLSMTWTRLTWLLYSAALGIGALWAYYTLGFGGYWAWDPVEVGNLIPWIALTALVHAQLYGRRRRMFTWVAPLLAVVVVATTLFSTFEVRSGFVFSPIHGFTGSVIAGQSVVGMDTPSKLVLILENLANSRFFVSMLTALLLATGALYVWRFIEVRRGEGRRPGAVPYASMTVLAVLAAWALVDVTSLYRAAFSISAFVGGGNVSIGLLVMVVAMVGVPLAWIMATSPQEEGEEGSPIVTEENLVLASVSILSIWFAVTVLLLVLGAGGLPEGAFESRLPLIVVPLGAALTVYAGWRYIGGSAALALAAGLAIAGTILFFLLGGSPVLGLYLPLMTVGLALVLYKLFRIVAGSRLTKTSAAGALLMAAAILGVLMWGSGRTELPFVGVTWGQNFWLGVGGFGLSLLAIIGAVSAAKRAHFPIALAGSLAGIGAIGYGPGAALAAASVVLLMMSKARFRKTHPLRLLTTALATASPHIAHAGIALLFVGYASSTFLAQDSLHTLIEADVEDLSAAQPFTTGPYAFTLAASGVVDTDGDGGYEHINATVETTKGRDQVGSVDIAFSWNETLHLYVLDIATSGDPAMAHSTVEGVEVFVGDGGAGMWVMPWQSGTQIANGTVERVNLKVSLFEGLSRDSPISGGGYVIGLKDSRGYDTTGDSLVDRLETDLSLKRAGGQEETVTLEALWDATPGVQLYRTAVSIQTRPAADVYLIPIDFFTAPDGWVRTADRPGRRYSSGEVTGVLLEVMVKPGMDLLWGGFFLAVVGMGLRLSCDRWPPKRSR